jgi:hypothetical protein
MSVEIWTIFIVGLTFALYIYIGWRSRVRDSAGFYVAGQGVPAIANGAATHKLDRDLNGAFNILLKALRDTSLTGILTDFQVLPYSVISDIRELPG